ncbi:MAG: hypothetical protein AVDCRST_MAG73-3001 [uncultured Thermomicrobiales bacterium]|uniref:Uncharacterized protein n=1 Tax=uncultured Thermomicrobiales bacterium TaxID=1645740 RepID=A0A6J4UKC8_9BACT|nr:MAG: hypothetical protein AVDCRST_MAG73-3001 [uncultured Thermomicrobiales bacterium]
MSNQAAWFGPIGPLAGHGALPRSPAAARPPRPGTGETGGAEPVGTGS